MRSALRILAILIVAVTSAAWLLLSATAQKRRDNFLHSTAAHKKIGCASCHNIPTPNWKRSRAFPDVADYPGHSSCVQCHRDDFFRGNNPAICTICHTNPSPRNGVRFPFPVGSRSHEFTTIFPHDVHQDIIARNERPDGIVPAHLVLAYGSLPGGSSEEILSPERQQDASATAGRMPTLQWGGTVPAHFVNASFSPAAFPADDPPPAQFNSCAICHQTATELPKFGNRQPMRGTALAEANAESFVPKAGFFKSSPEGHASCFTCHYREQKPIRTDCAGCHSLSAPYFESGVTKRYSVKFDHQYPEHVNDCSTCHIRITQNADLASMKDADVPFMSCANASCHGKDLTLEMKKRTESIANKQPVFQCFYCHTPEIGRFEVPASHIPR